jgi:hypothetical protein
LVEDEMLKKVLAQIATDLRYIRAIIVELAKQQGVQVPAPPESAGQQ